MRLTIDRTGDHDPPWPHMIVDASGCLVDLSGLPGPLQDPNVVKLDWGPFLEEGRECGRIFRKPPGFPVAQVEVFGDRAVLAPYLRAFKDRMAEIEAATAAHLKAEAEAEAAAAAAQEQVAVE